MDGEEKPIGAAGDVQSAVSKGQGPPLKRVFPGPLDRPPEITEDFEDEEKWGGHGHYMTVKKRKLLAQYADAARGAVPGGGEISSKIFQGISLHVNGSTDPSADEIKRLMMLHGGQFHLYYSSKKTSHIVASNLPYTKMVQLKKPVVKPAWISESIRANRLLPWQNFELYPMAIQEKSSSAGQTKIDSKNGEGPSRGPQFPPSNSHLVTPTAGSSTAQFNHPFIHKNAQNSMEVAKNFQKPLEPRSTDMGCQQVSKATKVAQDAATKLVATMTDLPLAQKAGDPNYLNQFYARSRLHHLSLWKVEAKQLVERLQEESDGTFPGRQRLRENFPGRHFLPDFPGRQPEKNSKSVIMHIDFDCFFVSVGLVTRPHLVDKPVACCHGRTGLGQMASNHRGMQKGDQHEDAFNSKSEVASCNYVARKAGLKNGMFLGPAKQLCPNLVTIPYEFEEYKRISTIFYQTVASYTLNIEAVSCDEMIVDCTDVLQDTATSPDEFASFLRQEIFVKSGGCHVSAGLAGNPLLARLATKKAKPNGQMYVGAEDVCRFLADIPIADLPGVGRSALRKFNSLNAASTRSASTSSASARSALTCADLKKFSLEKLQSVFGEKIGQKFHNFGRGIDQHVVQNRTLRKSVSADVNYGMRMKNFEEFKTFFEELCREIEIRLQTAAVRGHTITLKLLVRHPDAPVEPEKFMGCGRCNAFNKSTTLIQPTHSAELIAKEGLLLFRKMDLDVKEVRGIGLQLTRLIPTKKRKMEKSSVDLDSLKEDIYQPKPANIDLNFEQPDTDVDDLDNSESSLSSSPAREVAAPQYSDGNYPPPSLASHYNLVSEVGWLRVFQKLATDLRGWLDATNSKNSPENFQPTFLRKFSGNLSMSSMLSDFPQGLTHRTSKPASSLGKSFFLENKSSNYESVKENSEFSSLVSTPSGALDSACQAVFEGMLQETECKFWLNHFDVAEDFCMTELPSTFHGATLNYLDRPLVSRENELGGKFSAPIVTWAIWKLNAMYGDEWFEVAMRDNWTAKDSLQARLELDSVSATQAVRQQSRNLKIRGALEIPPVIPLQTKIQTKLKTEQLVAPPTSVSLPSLSQLDPDSMAALPTDLLDEIFDMYRTAGFKKIKKSDASTSGTSGLAKSHAQSRTSKNKTKIDLPVRKPRAKTSKKSTNQPSIESFMKLTKSTRSSQETKKSSTITVETIVLDSDGEVAKDLIIPAATSVKRKKTQEGTASVETMSIGRKVHPLSEKTGGNFFENLANFVEKSSPDVECREAISRWCCLQLKNQRLSEVDRLLNFFHREVEFLKSVSRKRRWMEAHQEITREIAQKIKEKFGSSLSVRSFFK